jgi:hypothetical protein
LRHHNFRIFVFPERARKWLFNRYYRNVRQLATNFPSLPQQPAEAAMSPEPLQWGAPKYVRELPEDFDLVNYLIDAIKAGDCCLRQLFQIEAGYMAVQKECLLAVLAPYALHGEVRMAHNAFPCLRGWIASDIGVGIVQCNAPYWSAGDNGKDIVRDR